MQCKYGIDFGTTNSSIGFMFKEDDKEHTWIVDVKEQYPRTTLPSIVLVDDKGNIEVGKDAIDKYSENIANNIDQLLIRKIKMDLETSGSSLEYTVGSKTYKAKELIGAIFKKLIDKADICALKADVEISGAVLGVPVQYGDIQKNILREALLEAELYSNKKEAIDNTEFVSEPIAVAVNYGLNLDSNKNVLVFDFGGGTLDLALVNLKKQVGNYKLHPHETIAKDRMTIGGEEITRTFFENSFCSDEKYGSRNIARSLRVRGNASPSDLWDTISKSASGAEFISRLEECKFALSTDRIYRFSFLGANNFILENMKFYRDDFEIAINDITERIYEFVTNLIDRCIESGKLEEKYEIDYVIMAGGSSLIPKVQEILYDIFGKTHVIAGRFDNDDKVARLKSLNGSRRSKIKESEVLTSIVRGLAAVGFKQEDMIDDLVESDYGVWDDDCHDFIPIINSGSKIKDIKIDKARKIGPYQEVECTDQSATRVDVKVFQMGKNGPVKLGTISINNPGGMRYKIFMQVDSKKNMLEVFFYDCINKRWMEDIPLNERRYELR